MKSPSSTSCLLPICAGLLGFAAALALLRTDSSRIWRRVAGIPSAPTADEKAMGHRDFVLHVLGTRRSNPERSPGQWMRFLTALDGWYRADRIECKTSLQAHQFSAILRLVDTPLVDLSTSSLISLLRVTQDSRTQVDCYEELWRRSVKDGPHKCAELFASMSKLQRPLFRNRLLKLWVEANGLDSLSEIADQRCMSRQDVMDAFELCAKADPEGCIGYLETDRFQSLCAYLEPVSPGCRRRFLTKICMNLPAERALALLEREPPTTYRETSICNVVAEAVKKDPQLAQEMIARYPNLAPNICGVAYAYIGNSPKTAAELINVIKGERLRTSTARNVAQIMLQLPPDHVETFIQSLTEPLTRETVRAGVREARKLIPADPPEG